MLLIHTLQMNIHKSLNPRRCPAVKDRVSLRLPRAGFIIIPGKSWFRERNADAAHLPVAMIHTLYTIRSEMWKLFVFIYLFI